VVALQLSSTQFSPRLLRNFLRDRPNQVVLGVFVGTFAYSAGGLFTVGISSGERSAEFPRFAVSVAVALLFLSLALLIFFADHLAHSIQVDSIMRVVERGTLPVIGAALFTCEDPTPVAPQWAMPVTSRRSGYVQAVDVRQLRTAAAAGRLTVLLRPRVGEHIVAGTVLAWAWRPSPDAEAPPEALVAAMLDRAVRIGFERTLEQDPGFGLRQLTDIGCKALSPGINDPYTAVQAIEHLAVLFAALAVRPVGDHVGRDASGSVVLVVPGRRFSDHLSLGPGLLRRYGAGEPTVVQALLRLLGCVAAVGRDDPKRWAAIEEQARLLVADAESAVRRVEDLAPVYAEGDALSRALSSRRAAQPS
jgi:uncharacterized membrane protein